MPFTDIIGHERPIAFLKTVLRHGQLGHAYLFHGADGIGKRQVAIRLAQTILCEQNVDEAQTDSCGGCRECLQVEARTHPDFLLIEPDPEQATPQIKIEQIRELESQVVYRPLIAARKVFIVDEADRLTIGAANALLKTLEEPPTHALFLLVTSRIDALPATIRSRCQRLRFAAPSQEQVQRTLTACLGWSAADAQFVTMLTESRIGQAMKVSPASLRTQEEEFCTLAAAKALQSPASVLTIAETLHRADRAADALAWLARWVRDLILTRTGAEPEFLINQNRRAALEQGWRADQLDQLLELYTTIDQMERSATRNLNLQLALESILLRLRDILIHTPRVASGSIPTL
jgi:DNA polymerase-3 subunit delta'